jgi:hypothetical protein
MINNAIQTAPYRMRTWDNSALVALGVVTPFLGRCSAFGGSLISAYVAEMPNFDNTSVTPGVRSGSPPV